MSSEAPTPDWMNPAAGHTPGADHPAGDIRLPRQSSVGRRAQLLAGADALTDEGSTIIETSFSLSFN
jgi:hypothetical protein